MSQIRLHHEHDFHLELKSASVKVQFLSRDKDRLQEMQTGGSNMDTGEQESWMM